MKKKIINITLLFSSILFTLLLCELVLNFYATNILKQGRLFEFDSLLGWKVLPNLNLERKAGNLLWQVITDSTGNRGKSSFDNKKPTKVVIIGDSFAFGEGVDVEKRFDSQWGENYSTVNLGVMGYGTDQQLLAGKKYFSTLKKDDIVVVLSYWNDIYDLVSTSNGGREKPYYTLDTEKKLSLHYINKNNVINKMRDESYLLNVISKVFAKQAINYSEETLFEGKDIYLALLRNHLPPLLNKGVKVIIVQVSFASFLPSKVYTALKTDFQADTLLNKYTTQIEIGLDQIPKECYIIDNGHWNQKGHKIMGDTLLKIFNNTDLVKQIEK